MGGRHLIEVRADTDELTKVHLDPIQTDPGASAHRQEEAISCFGPYRHSRGEAHPPAYRKRIKGKLLTDLEVRSREEAVEKIKWYAMRWKIEVFHKSSSRLPG